MEIILLEKIGKLGNLGDKVAVKAGYARNYLIPQSKAVLATKKNTEYFEQRRADLEKQAQQNLSQAEQRAAKLSDISLVVSALSSDEGRLYGSVGVSEIKQAFAEKSIEVNKREIVLSEGPIHSVGDYTIEIHLHSDVVATVQLQVVPVKKN